MPKPFTNPHVQGDDTFTGLFSSADYRDVEAFFAARPELTSTPLRSLPRLASELGIASLHVKDETARFGVNAFKIVGVSYAVHKIGADAASRGLVCATAGNHGRAVARVARDHGVPCTVFVPSLKTQNPLEHRTRQSRVGAMREDGARVIEVDGTYEEAVGRAAAFGEETGGTIVSDTSWPGYEQVPRWIMLGYTHLFEEASRQWTNIPTHVVIQGGVGGLVCAAASWFAYRFGSDRPVMIAAEPDNAACLLASAQAGHPVHIGGSLDTIMAGLRCAEPSPAAWPAIAAAIDAFVTVSDAEVERTMAALEREGIIAGPSGACSVSALQAVVAASRTPEPPNSRASELPNDRTTELPNHRSMRALAVITEGA
jgi:diaminopropionate ammonia-lyase